MDEKNKFHSNYKKLKPENDLKGCWKCMSAIASIPIPLLIFITICILVVSIVHSHILRQQTLNALFVREGNNMNFTSMQGIIFDIGSFLDTIFNKQEIYVTIRSVNFKQIVNNKFLNTVKPEDRIIIAVRVNTAADHLRHLITSLSKVLDNEKLLIVFVHSSYDTKTIDVIKNVKNIKYVELFYPYATKLYKNSYPGQGEYFCTNEIGCTKNTKRNATLIEDKHLWWWTVSQVFNLTQLQNYTRHVIFVDEKSYIAEDIIKTLEHVNDSVVSLCQHCEFISFGGLSSNNSELQTNITVSPFSSNTITNGLAFNRSTWDKIKASEIDFCTFNDYSWVQSLVNVIKNSVHQFYVISTSFPKVFSTENCTANGNEVFCKIGDKEVNSTGIKKYLDRDYIYSGMKFVISNVTSKIEPLQRGGWEDARDHELCSQMGVVKFF